MRRRLPNVCAACLDVRQGALAPSPNGLTYGQTATTDDIRAIIARMREAANQFELGVKKPVAERKSNKSVSLEDLGL